ncbi:MAG: penicillin-binding protein 2 [Candidatus Nanopelagicales bacterium]
MTDSTRQRPPARRAPARRPAPPPAPLRLGNPRRRAGILLVFVLVVFTLFAGRLLEIQAFRGDALAAAAVDQRTTTVKVLADRGDIVDARGVPLAMTVESRHVTVDQTLITDPLGTATAIAGVLGTPAGPLVERLTGERRFAYVVKDISPEQWRIIDDLDLVGIYSERTLKRVYPSGDVAANVVGFVGGETGGGLAGVEYALDDRLAGVDGSRTFERVSGVAIPGSAETLEQPQPGAPVQLTIDRDIQYVAQRALANEVMATGAESGSIVVMDPRNGDILALAVAPTFDANSPGAADEANRGNRAITDVFEPGSTSKVITVAAVLEEGGADANTMFEIPPTLDRGGKTFHDATDHGGYNWDLAMILAQSSNIGTILAAETVPQDTVFSYFDRFGLGKPSGVGLPGESPGYLPPLDTWSATTFPTMAFGQGFSVNAIQMADVFATIANDGVRMPARIFTDPAMPSSEGERVISERTAKTIREMLERVVADGGTAPMAGIPGYRVGGKTGTAQVIDPQCRCYDGDTIGSFIGMAPIEDPELVIAVTIVKPKVTQMGGELAGPVFREVMTYALQAQRVAPITPKSRSPR